MKETLQRRLFNEFPKLYRQRELSPRETAMCWGIECGNGWFDLIRMLSAAITKLAPEVEALQVKEKYGTLRFYTSGDNTQVADIIRLAEALSGTVCEECGSVDGKLAANEVNWWGTLCDECRGKDEKN